MAGTDPGRLAQNFRKGKTLSAVSTNRPDDSFMGIDKELISAYEETEYRVLDPAFCIQIGAFHPHLDQWLSARSFETWAYITAWNPGSKRITKKENNRRQEELKAELENRGMIFYPGLGEHPTGRWEAEESLWIPGCSLDLGLLLARKFDQNAIVYGKVGEIAQLIWNE